MLWDKTSNAKSEGIQTLALDPTACQLNKWCYEGNVDATLETFSTPRVPFSRYFSIWILSWCIDHPTGLERYGNEI